MVRLIIAGSREIDDYGFVSAKLDKILKNIEENENIEIISGTCKGVDKLGERYAKENDINLKKFPADWQNLDVEICVIKENKYGKYNALAGPSRNQKMVDYAKQKDGILIAFVKDNSSGTMDIIDRARKVELKVRIIKILDQLDFFNI